MKNYVRWPRSIEKYVGKYRVRIESPGEGQGVTIVFAIYSGYRSHWVDNQYTLQWTKVYEVDRTTACETISRNFLRGLPIEVGSRLLLSLLHAFEVEWGPGSLVPRNHKRRTTVTYFPDLPE